MPFGPKKLERIAKGFANHHRIAILQHLDKNPELSLQEIADNLKMNLKTTSEHTRRLAIAGLIIKRYDHREVRHKVTDLGKDILIFLRKLE